LSKREVDAHLNEKKRAQCRGGGHHFLNRNPKKRGKWFRRPKKGRIRWRIVQIKEKRRQIGESLS